MYVFHIAVERWLCDRVRDGLFAVRDAIHGMRRLPPSAIDPSKP